MMQKKTQRAKISREHTGEKGNMGVEHKEISRENMRVLTHWGRVTQICGSKLATLPGRRQTSTWNNAEILSIRTLETNFS